MRRPKTTRKVDLRKAYELGGYSGEYSWFVREKVIPIIGEASLHSKASKAGSRVREYTVTKRNLQRITKALGIDSVHCRSLQAVKKAVKKVGPEATAEVLLSLIQSTSQPTASKDFPIRYRIPIHPLSHNRLYKASRNRMVRDPIYNKWRTKFFPLISGIVKETEVGVDFSKPLEVLYKFGHREASDKGGVFDRPNFQKAAQDCIFEHFGHDDSKVLDSSISGEFVDSYKDGYIEFSIRNT